MITENDEDRVSRLEFSDPELAKTILARTREELKLWSDNQKTGSSIEGDWHLTDKLKEFVGGSDVELAQPHMSLDVCEVFGLHRPRATRNTTMNLTDGEPSATSNSTPN
ncbi:hypothetical protein I302_104796 [Kwoniella bestiolae CBS 10118]|uniref:Uncharacterized protein n=1 Tax=Kwoniella bestiolae CBS 10118 TaxID=1296100 RepID=A0A1B9FRR9_9TREE|nr:hypothetical protein I302_09135 [Kwoniella bestiolae CBS 10118]OCF21456.1 hypothetical protein I302_09135 [Kwoniella bestiolae CBS 10118]